MRIERHPLGVWVREDGCVYLPQSGRHHAHWTYGSRQTNGYRTVGVGGKVYKVHRLVADCFIPNPNNLPEIDHIDRVRFNNVISNLRWCSHTDNSRNTGATIRVESRGGKHTYSRELAEQRYASSMKSICERFDRIFNR